MEDIKMKIFDYVVQSGLLVALLGFAVSAIKYGKQGIDAKTKESTVKIKDTNTRHAVDTVENAATTVVYKMAQTTVDDLKEKAADGKLTADEIAQLKADSLAEVKQLVGTDVVNTIQTVFGDAEAWITAKIECAVKSMKLNAPITIVGNTTNYAPIVPASAADGSAAPLPTETITTPTETITIPGADAPAEAAQDSAPAASADQPAATTQQTA